MSVTRVAFRAGLPSSSSVMAAPGNAVCREPPWSASRSSSRCRWTQRSVPKWAAGREESGELGDGDDDVPDGDVGAQLSGAVGSVHKGRVVRSSRSLASMKPGSSSSTPSDSSGYSPPLRSSAAAWTKRRSVSKAKGSPAGAASAASAMRPQAPAQPSGPLQALPETPVRRRLHERPPPTPRTDRREAFRHPQDDPRPHRHPARRTGASAASPPPSMRRVTGWSTGHASTWAKTSGPR